jgi:hypothetical protein
MDLNLIVARNLNSACSSVPKTKHGADRPFVTVKESNLFSVDSVFSRLMFGRFLLQQKRCRRPRYAKKEAFATVLSGPEMYRVTLKKRKRSLERVVRVFLSFNKSDAEIEFLLSNWMSEEAVCDSSVGS